MTFWEDWVKYVVGSVDKFDTPEYPVGSLDPVHWDRAAFMMSPLTRFVFNDMSIVDLDVVRAAVIQ